MKCNLSSDIVLEHFTLKLLNISLNRYLDHSYLEKQMKRIIIIDLFALCLT